MAINKHPIGKTDTVPAMLTPGEAVVTKAANTPAHQKQIARWNKASKGKVPLGMCKGGMIKGYADGTDKVAGFNMQSPNNQAAIANMQARGDSEIAAGLEHISPGYGSQYLGANGYNGAGNPLNKASGAMSQLPDGLQVPTLSANRGQTIQSGGSFQPIWGHSDLGYEDIQGFENGTSSVHPAVNPKSGDLFSAYSNQSNHISPAPDDVYRSRISSPEASAQSYQSRKLGYNPDMNAERQFSDTVEGLQSGRGGARINASQSIPNNYGANSGIGNPSSEFFSGPQKLGAGQRALRAVTNISPTNVMASTVGAAGAMLQDPDLRADVANRLHKQGISSIYGDPNEQTPLSKFVNYIGPKMVNAFNRPSQLESSPPIEQEQKTYPQLGGRMQQEIDGLQPAQYSHGQNATIQNPFARNKFAALPQTQVQPEQSTSGYQGSDQIRANLGDGQSYLQSGNQAGISRVAAGLQQRGGLKSIGAPAQSPAAQAAGTTDFWLNRGFPGGAQQWQEKQQNQDLQNMALNGGNGNMSPADYHAANRRQIAAQHLLGIQAGSQQARAQLGAQQMQHRDAIGFQRQQMEYNHDIGMAAARQEQLNKDRQYALESAKPIETGGGQRWDENAMHVLNEPKTMMRYDPKTQQYVNAGGNKDPYQTAFSALQAKYPNATPEQIHSAMMSKPGK